MNDFERCPFCGGKDIRLLDRTAWYDSPYNRGKRAVICTDCGATMYGRNNEEAILRWNMREEDIRIKAIEEFVKGWNRRKPK